MDRNDQPPVRCLAQLESLSARRAWIEISHCAGPADLLSVALRKESVDRNIPSHWIISRTGGVALRKESVDRNVQNYNARVGARKSLSARRAWIEINVSKIS